MSVPAIGRVFIAFLSGFLAIVCAGHAANPVVEGVGLCDPKVRIYDHHAFLYATHDALPGSAHFIMRDWWVWTSDDLVNWRLVSVLNPEQTYYQKPSNSCWATDAIRHNGKYYFYFSRGPKEIGVVESDSPAGPWRDPIGKPLIAEGSTPTTARDPAIFQQSDGGTYIIFGCWDYYLARLNDDMVSLAEKPRKLEVSSKMGPYGAGKLDDKPFLFERNGKYYLSWGCYYTMSDDLYGPYHYVDSIIHKDRVEPIFQKGLTQDRHGSFFELYNQWYFICNDQSWPGACAHYRDSVMSYVHFRDNGKIDPIYINRIGVGEYNAQDIIPAANYFRGEGVLQKESPDGSFDVCAIHDGSVLAYPKITNVPANATISFRLANGNAHGATMEIHSGSANGPLLGRCHVRATRDWKSCQTISCPLKNRFGTFDISLVFRGSGNDLLHLESFSFLSH